MFPQFFVPPRAIRFCRQNFITVSLTTDDIRIGTSQLERKLQQDVEKVKYKLISWPFFVSTARSKQSKNWRRKMPGIGAELHGLGTRLAPQTTGMYTYTVDKVRPEADSCYPGVQMWLLHK